MFPMLCEPITSNQEVLELTISKDWYLQRKMDGERLLIRIDGKKSIGYNRKGIETFIPKTIKKDIELLNNIFVLLDGEIIDDVYYIFDALTNLQPEPFGIRYEDLYINIVETKNIKLVQTVTNIKEAKINFLQEGIKNHWEGFVFKNIHSSYEFGVRSFNWRKYKLFKTIDCIVKDKSNSQQVISLALLGQAGEVPIGSCKVPVPVLERLQAGSVVEIGYLYAKASNKLYQPTWRRIRPDKSPDECTIDQLVYKGKI